MITAKEIRMAFVDVLKANFPYEIHFDRVQKSNVSYFYVKFVPSRADTFSRVYLDRALDVEIQFVPLPNGNLRVKKSDIYDVADKLTAAFLPVFKVGKRYITINNSRSNIVDNILHYTFSLNFTDNFDVAEFGEGEYAKHLAMNLSGKNFHFVLKEDTDNGE